MSRTRSTAKFIKSKLTADGRWQVAISIMLGAIAVLVSLSMSHPIIAGSDQYLAVVIGLAGILVLVSAVTFGFLLYYLQGAEDERTNLYSRFLDQVRDLREFLDRLNRYGVIDRSYTECFTPVEGIRFADFPLGDSWKDYIMPLLDWLGLEKRDELELAGTYQLVGQGVLTRGEHIEETISSLGVNVVRRALVGLMLSPVIKSFRLLIVAILAIFLGIIYYGGIYAALLNGLAFAIGCMTILLFAAISFHLSAQTRELLPWSDNESESTVDEIPAASGAPESA